MSLVAAALAALLPGAASAYPDAEVDWSAGGGPPFSVGITGTTTGFLLLSDRRLAASYVEVLKLIDMGTYADEAVQPPALTTDDENTGLILGMTYRPGPNEIVVSQDSGNLLVFSLNDITAKPRIITVATGDKLGPIVLDSNGRLVYVADNTTRAIHTVDVRAGTVVGTVLLTVPAVTSFTITDAVFVDQTNEAFFTTDAGMLFAVPSGGATVTPIDIGITGFSPSRSLAAVAAEPAGNAVWVADATTPSIMKVTTPGHEKTETVELTWNKQLTDIAITAVTNPSATYIYVAGALGMNVVDAASGEVFDYGTDTTKDGEPLVMTATPFLLAPSSSTDGIVYVNFTTSGLGVLSDHPFAAISGLTFSDGSSSLKLHQSMTVTFLANQDGTYEIRAGGSVDASGTLLKDAAGNTSGTVAADSPTDVVINYDDNAGAFLEGANDLWVFVTANGLRGRRASSVTVDTPPPNVVIRSTGFGSGRVYVNMDRITVNDMATYNVYVDVDPDAVLTKTEVAAAVAQPASGDTVTGEVSGLENGAEYFIAVQAVDTGGNPSDSRTSTYADGTRVSETPQQTGGPAVFSGEKGCSLGGGGAASASAAVVLMASLLLLYGARRCRRKGLVVLVVLGLTIVAGIAHAQESTAIEERPMAAFGDRGKPTPAWWSFEAKTGFWMPQSSTLKEFFSPCCNLITRLQGGVLIHRRYGIELGVGFLYKSGQAVAEGTGEISQDKYKFMLIPLELSFAWRADYFDWRYIIPYLKAGFDGVIFEELDAGTTIEGIKFGMHGVTGVQINLTDIGDVREDFEDMGIKDFFLTLEAAYQWVDNFGGSGLNLTGPVFSAGFLFEF